MSQLRVIGLIGILLIFIGSIVTTYQPGGVGIIGIGAALLGFSVFMMFSEIHEVITREEIEDDREPVE